MTKPDNSPGRAYKILIADLIGMRFDCRGKPDHSEVQAYIETKGGIFHRLSQARVAQAAAGKLHFFYLPALATEQALLAETGAGQYDAVIAAATLLPPGCRFDYGGVRIGAGTGNMAAASWGGADGEGGVAPLMNTPGFNSRATAQMVFKALLAVLPNLDTRALHQRVIERDFDSGKNLLEYPGEKLEGKKIAILGYGHIGREVARLAKAFAMRVCIFARPNHQHWIRSQGYEYAASVKLAASGADVISVHLGLGALDPRNGCYANAGIINAGVLAVMNPGAVLVNYDRGELVDITALDRALTRGQLRHAAIDADIFKDRQSGKISGPLQPYLDIYPAHRGQMSLLPHAAADTDHDSRVAGAKQAVDQIFAAIVQRRVINLKGSLPSGYHDGKVQTPVGVGKVTAGAFAALSAGERQQMAQLSGTLAAFWRQMQGGNDGVAGLTEREFDSTYESECESACQSANQLFTLLADKGLLGPF